MNTCSAGKDVCMMPRTLLRSLTLSPVSNFESQSSTSNELIRLQTGINSHLPTTTWNQIPVPFDPNIYRVTSLTLQHGVHFPQLSVRVLHDHVLCRSNTSYDVRHMHPSGKSITTQRAAQLDDALRWLLQSLGDHSSYSVLGLSTIHDSSSGEVRLLQLSTASRCVIIRIPQQSNITTYMEQIVPQASHSIHSLFTPLLHDILRNRAIYKSGAELWSVCLDLWRCCPGVEVNGALNMSWIHRHDDGCSLSLESMVARSIGADFAFTKDKEVAKSNWNSNFLSIRQIIYAALEGQASWMIGSNQRQIPVPRHMSDMPKAWLDRAANWMQVIRNFAIEIEAKRNRTVAACNHASCAPGMLAIFPAKCGPRFHNESLLIRLANSYFATYFQGEEPFNPFIASLFGTAFPTMEAAKQLFDVVSNSQGVNAPAAVSAPGGLVMPGISCSSCSKLNSVVESRDGGLRYESSNVVWWFSKHIEPNFDYSYSEQEYFTRLDAKQRSAIQASDRARIHCVLGLPGAGSSTLAAVEAVRSLKRSTSVNLQDCGVSTCIQSYGHRQRVLCVTSSDSAAALLASKIAESVDSKRMVVFLANEYRASWPEGLYHHLRVGGFVNGLDGECEDCSSSFFSSSTSYADSVHDSNRDILICTVDFALHSVFGERFFHRQTLIVDVANELPTLKMILLLRKLPHTERIILMGDEKQFGARLGSYELENILSTALTSAPRSLVSLNSIESITKANNVPAPFSNISTSILQHSYRVKPHLASILNRLFYHPTPNLMIPAQASDLSRVVGWVDVKGQARLHSTDASLGYANLNEIYAIVQLWNYYALRPGFTSDQIAVLCMFEYQRRCIVKCQPSMAPRVFTVDGQYDNFVGQEASIVLLTLSSPRIVPAMEDWRRIHVALTRAKTKLFIIGDRTALIASAAQHSLWHEIDAFEYLDMEEVFPHLAVNQGTSFPPLPAAALMPSQNVGTSASSSPTHSDATASKSSPSQASHAIDSADSIPANSRWNKGPLQVSESRPKSVSPPADHHIFEKLKADQVKLSICPKYWNEATCAPRVSKGRSACTKGDRCCQIHNEYWMRAPPAFGNTYWLITPGRPLIQVYKGATPARQKQIDDFMNTNRVIAKNRQLFGDEVAYLFQEQEEKPTTPDTTSSSPAVPITPASVSSSSSTSIVAQLNGISLEDRLLSSVEELLKFHQSGIPMNQLEAEYAKHFNAEWKTYSNQSLEAFVKTCASANMAKFVTRMVNDTMVASLQSNVMPPVESLPQKASVIEPALNAPTITPVHASPADNTPVATIDSVTTAKKQRALEKKERIASEKERKRADRARVAAEIELQKQEEAKAAAAARKNEEFQTANKKHTARHPDALAASIAADLAGENGPQLKNTYDKLKEPTKEHQLTANSTNNSPLHESEYEEKKQSEVITSIPASHPPSKQKSLPTSSSSSAATSPILSATSSAIKIPIIEDDLVDPYPSMSSDRYLMVNEINDLTKAQRKKLQWLCYSCDAPNGSGFSECELCSTKKPSAKWIRFFRSSQIQSGNAFTSFTAIGKHIEYESEFVKVVKLSDNRGFHLVTKQAVTAGTILLIDQTMFSKFEEQSCQEGMPNSSQATSLAMTMIADPIQMELLSKYTSLQIFDKWNMNYDEEDLDNFNDVVNGVMKKAGISRVSPKVWSNAFHLAVSAHFSLERRTNQWCCMKSRHGRYRLPRQAHLLEANCWPNCAVVQGVSSVSNKDDCAIIAVSNLEAGTVLTDLNVGSQNWDTLRLPRSERAALLSTPCKCGRCCGSGNPRGLAGDKLLLEWHPHANNRDKTNHDSREFAQECSDIMKRMSNVEYMESKVRLAEKGREEKRRKKGRSVNDDNDEDEDDTDRNTHSKYLRTCYDQFEDIVRLLRWAPLHPSHWQLQRVRSRLISLVIKEKLYDMETYLSQKQPADGLELMHPSDDDISDSDHEEDDHEHGSRDDSDDDSEGESESEHRKDDNSFPPPTACERRAAHSHTLLINYNSFLLGLLFVLSQDIESNRCFYAEMEPAKSESFLLLDNLIKYLANSKRVVQPNTKDSSRFEKLHSSLIQVSHATDDDDDDSSDGSEASSSPSCVPSKSVADEWHDEHGSFDQLLPYYDGIGTREGQEGYLKHLSEMDPAFVKLKELGFPQRLRTKFVNTLPKKPSKK